MSYFDVIEDARRLLSPLLCIWLEVDLGWTPQKPLLFSNSPGGALQAPWRERERSALKFKHESQGATPLMGCYDNYLTLVDCVGWIGAKCNKQLQQTAPDDLVFKACFVGKHVCYRLVYYFLEKPTERPGGGIRTNAKWVLASTIIL